MLFFKCARCSASSNARSSSSSDCSSSKDDALATWWTSDCVKLSVRWKQEFSVFSDHGWFSHLPPMTAESDIDSPLCDAGFRLPSDSILI